MKMHFQKRAAFTLIELLVVTSVIAVLAGLTVTATRGVQQRSRQTKELHAARQIIAAYLTFPNDHDGDLMRGYDKHVQEISFTSGRTVTGEMCCRYPWRLAPYLGEQAEEIFLLNDNRSKTDSQAKDSFEYQYRVSLHPALGLNAYCVGGYDDGSNSGLFQSDVVTRMAQAVRPASLIVFASARMKTGADLSLEDEIAGNFLVKPPKFWRTKWTAKFDREKPSSSFGNVAPRWDGRAVCAFLDGSVRSLNEKQLQDMRHWSNTAAERDDPDFVVPR